MKQLIINADDFGLTAGVTKGIVEAANKGGVTSTTAMMCVPSGIENIENNIEKLTVPCGVRLQLTGHNSAPLTADILDACVETDGYFPRNPYKVRFKPAHVKAEWKAQIERFSEIFGKPSHLDSHHGFHNNEDYKKAALELATEFNLPIRGGIKPPQNGTPKQVAIIEKRWSTTGKPVEFLMEAIKESFNQTKIDTFELVTHPGFSDNYLKEISSMNSLREQEMEILCSTEFKDFLKSESISLISYADL